LPRGERAGARDFGEDLLALEATPKMYGDVIARGVFETAFDEREERVLAGTGHRLGFPERDFSGVVVHHRQRYA
jgi:hypothetical protein